MLCLLCSNVVSSISETLAALHYTLVVQVTSGGPVLGVSMENTSGGSSYASLPMAAILGLAVAILGMQM